MTPSLVPAPHKVNTWIEIFTFWLSKGTNGNINATLLTISPWLSLEQLSVNSMNIIGIWETCSKPSFAHILFNRHERITCVWKKRQNLNIRYHLYIFFYCFISSFYLSLRFQVLPKGICALSQYISLPGVQYAKIPFCTFSANTFVENKKGKALTFPSLLSI